MPAPDDEPHALLPDTPAFSSLRDRSQTLLDVLASRVNSSASAIALWDPFTKSHVTMTNEGYPNQVMDYFNTGFVGSDPLFKHMEHVGTGALRWKDFPGYLNSLSVREFFRPAGFQEGLSARLVTSGGIYVGVLHVNSDSPRYPSPEDVSYINALRNRFAATLDIRSRPALVAEFISPGSPAWLVARNGAALPLHPELPDDLADPQLSTLVRSLAGTATSFRVPRSGLPPLFFGMYPTSPLLPFGAPTSLVITRVEDLPFGISHRELEVLTLVARGFTATQAGEFLSISPKTVGHHIEHLLTKTGARNRVELAARATVDGLFSATTLFSLLKRSS